jgi:hypothetical protein
MTAVAIGLAVLVLILAAAAATWRARALAGVTRVAQLTKELAASRAAVAELRASRGLATPGALAVRQLGAINQKAPNGDRVRQWEKVSGAISSRAGGDFRLGGHLRRVADELLAAGLDHDEVARRILAGDTADI